MQIAQRIQLLGVEQAFGVLARAKAMERQGADMIHMEIGDLDKEAPEAIRTALRSAIANHHTHYVPSQGALDFRQAAAEYLTRTRNIQFVADDIVATPGGKPLIFYTILATVNPGDEVIIPDPGYPAYESVVRFVGGVPVFLPLRFASRFNFSPDELEKLVTPRTRLIILNSPHNPTGGVLAHACLQAVADVATRNDCWVLSDEVYDRHVYAGLFESIIQFPGMKDRTILANAFTKSFSMSGWRLGFGAVPRVLVPVFSNLVNNTVSCTASFVQHAGIAGFTLTEKVFAERRNELRRRRDALHAALKDLPGVSCHLPDATIYLFPNISATGRSSAEIFEILLNEANIAVLPGTAFGPGGEGFIRLSFGASPLPRIEEAAKRLRAVWPRIIRA